MSRIEEIRGTMLAKMREYDVEPTDENQLEAMKFLRDAWDSAGGSGREYTLTKVALTAEISKLTMKLKFNR